MSSESNNIVIICAPDGEEWGVFIQKKLSSAEYNINTSIKDYRVKISELSCYKVQVVLLSPELLYGALDTPTWNFSEFEKSSTVMILLGLGIQDIKEQLGADSEYVFKTNHETIHPENPGESLAKALVEIIKVYERDDDLVDDPVDDPFDEFNIYQYPPSPRQINQIYRVISPPDGKAKAETLILLDRKADGDVMVDLNNEEGVKVKANFLDKAVYSVNIPESTVGPVSLRVSCNDQVIGEDQVNLKSKLDQLRSLLQDMTNPLSLMCQALGMDSESSELLDSSLSRQIKNQWSSQNVHLLQFLEPNLSEEKSDQVWPTLAHFMAEFNLVKTCQEMLKFPSSLMVMSCCMRNSKDEYPYEIAERKGYSHIAKLLVQVVEQHQDSGVVTELPPPQPHLKAMRYVNQPGYDQRYQGHTDRDSTYMDMSQVLKATSERNSAPSPCHRTTQSKGGPGGQRTSAPAEGKSRISFMNPEYTETSSSGSEPSPQSPSAASREEIAFSSGTTSSPPIPPKKCPTTPPKPQILKESFSSPKSQTIRESSQTHKPDVFKPQTLPRTLLRTSDSYSSSPEASPRSSLVQQSSEVSPVSPVRNNESEDFDATVANRNSAETKHIGELFENMKRARSESEPAYLSSMNTSHEERLEAQDQPTGLLSDAFQQPSLRETKTTRARISSFLKRLGMKKQSSDLEHHKSDKGKKKAVIYQRQSRGSDPGFEGMSFAAYQSAGGKTAKYSRKMSLPAVLEPPEVPEARDSGSFSEEEEESANSDRTSYRKKVNKFSSSGKQKSLERKKSVRLSRAMNETISNAPSMPQSSSHLFSKSTKT